MSAFAGVAEAYQRYRVPYPDTVFDWIVREHGLDGRGRLLDAGCGTGYVCLPLSNALGQRAADFERDLRQRLVRLAPNDRYVEDIELTIISARK